MPNSRPMQHLEIEEKGSSQVELISMRERSSVIRICKFSWRPLMVSQVGVYFELQLINI